MIPFFLLLAIIVFVWIMWDSVVALFQMGSAENDVAKLKVKKAVNKVKKTADKIKKELDI